MALARGVITAYTGAEITPASSPWREEDLPRAPALPPLSRADP
jgi:hypothetical protein